MALVLNESFRGRGWLRAVVLVPWAIPTVVASQMWRFIFNDRYGLFNFLLFGDATDRYWAPLAEPGLALMSIMVADIWKTSSFAALIILAGLQGIPGELYEAASIDGAERVAKVSPYYSAIAQAGAAFSFALSHHRRAQSLRSGLRHDPRWPRRYDQRAAILWLQEELR